MIPKLNGCICGFSLKTGALIVLYSTVAITFFGLIFVTTMRLEADKEASNQTESKDNSIITSELDIPYIMNMVVSILCFMVAPVSLYGVYHERPSFLMPFLAVCGIGIILLVVNLALVLMDENYGACLFVLGFMCVVSYFFLVVYSLKEQSESSSSAL